MDLNSKNLINQQNCAKVFCKSYKVAMLNFSTTVQKLLQTLTNTIGESSMENSLSDFRIFPLKYANRYRTVSTNFSDDFGEENGNNGLQMLIALNISCGELNNEYPNDVISVVSDSNANFKVSNFSIAEKC